MRKLIFLMVFCVFASTVAGCGQEIYEEKSQPAGKISIDKDMEAPAAKMELSTDISKTPLIDDNILLDKLDKSSDETISYVYKQSSGNTENQAVSRLLQNKPAEADGVELKKPKGFKW